MTDHDAEKILLNELATYYSADELSGFIDDGLERFAKRSVGRIVRRHGPQAAIQTAQLLDEMTRDKGHPLFEEILLQSLYAWNGDAESWARFQELAAWIRDGLLAETHQT